MKTTEEVPRIGLKPSRVGDGLVGPINVFSMEMRDVVLVNSPDASTVGKSYDAPGSFPAQ